MTTHSILEAEKNCIGNRVKSVYGRAIIISLLFVGFVCTTFLCVTCVLIALVVDVMMITMTILFRIVLFILCKEQLLHIIHICIRHGDCILHRSNSRRKILFFRFAIQLLHFTQLLLFAAIICRLGIDIGAE